MHAAVIKTKKKIYTLGTVLKYNRKIKKRRSKIDTSNTQIHDHSSSWLGASTSIRSGRAKLVFGTQINTVRNNFDSANRSAE
jgi:hypothetical protein